MKMYLAILVLIALTISGCNKNCRKEPFITESFNKSNFVSVPFEKYQQIPVNYIDNETGCPTPEKIKIPQSILKIDDLLSKGQKISLYIKPKYSDDGGIYASRWENLYLKLFGSNGNFSIMDSAFFNKAERTVTSAGLKVSSDELGFLSQTDRTKIIEATGVTHMYILNNARVRNGAFRTTYFSGRLIDMAAGKVIAVDEAED